MEDIKPPKPERPSPVKSADTKSESPSTVETVVSLPTQNKPKKPQGSWHERLRQPFISGKKWWKNASPKQRGLAIGASLGLVIGIGLGVYAIFSPEPEPITPIPVIIEPEPEPEPEPTTVASELTGVQVEPELAELPVTAVVIENSPDARPQSGLAEAGVVFEAMVEGSITRFLALYQEQNPKQIGPLRSVRRNHIDWYVGFDAALAHVGGSPVALNRIRNQGLRDLDQFQNPEAYRRVNTRFAPHNMYSDRASLLKVHEKRGYNSSDYTGFARKAPEPADNPDATQIDVAISGPRYNVRFDYDSESNTYKRFMGGVPHVDEQSNKQIQSEVVVVMVADYRRDGIYSVYSAIGSGTAFIFQDGTVVKGTWEKRSAKENVRFGDENGAPIGLNPGQTWITLATNENKVSVKP